MVIFYSRAARENEKVGRGFKQTFLRASPIGSCKYRVGWYVYLNFQTLLKKLINLKSISVYYSLNLKNVLRYLRKELTQYVRIFRTENMDYSKDLPVTEKKKLKLKIYITKNYIFNVSLLSSALVTYL